MLVLGIESTAHTFGVGIVDCKKKEVLFNEKIQFQNDVGMDPRKLLDFHVANFDSVLMKAKDFLKTKKKSFSDLDLISFSQGPGLGNALKVGACVAKTLSLKYKISIVGVNHIKAHLEIGKMLTGFKDPIFIYTSGVNTQIIAKDEFGKYKIYGETEDIGLGNLIDSSARLLGLGFPGGPLVEKEALKSKNYIELPYVVKGMNISLAGMHSKIKELIRKGEKREDICYSLQETIFAQVLEVAERAIAYTQKKEMLIVGGVAANKRFNEMCEILCMERGIKFEKIPFQYVLDNAAMIAWQGYVDRNNSLGPGEWGLGTRELKPLPYVNVESDL
ncbi:MAG: tRNA (adenosine(37)-N6)-threonylcarbamoyltransferase complex transferase subunit TsaD [Nanoarchaeota archaeon]